MQKVDAPVDAPKGTPSTDESDLGIRADSTTPTSGWAPAGTTTGDQTPQNLGLTSESKYGAGDNGFASHVSEIRRLYAEGEVAAALDLASVVRASTMGFSLHAVPVVALTPKEVLSLPLDPRSGFLLARIDGTSTLQTLLDVSAMPAGDTMALLEELLALGAVRLLPPVPRGGL